MVDQLLLLSTTAATPPTVIVAVLSTVPLICKLALLVYELSIGEAIVIWGLVASKYQVLLLTVTLPAASPATTVIVFAPVMSETGTLKEPFTRLAGVLLTITVTAFASEAEPV